MTGGLAPPDSNVARTLCGAIDNKASPAVNNGMSGLSGILMLMDVLE
jgi:hypothetical protein